MNFLNFGHFATRIREFGPYFLAALLLPGGLIVALLVWLHQRHHHGEAK